MKNYLPLVTIICTSYNHAAFIEETLDSILAQNYSVLELIFIENGSMDDSVKVFRKWVNLNRPKFSVHTFFHQQTVPYCSAFNQALSRSKGEYVIDLSGDDLLEADHIYKSVQRLLEDPDAAFSFSDALLFEENGVEKSFYKRDEFGKLQEIIKEGDRYLDIVQSHCICSATLVFRANLLKAAGGYDEELTYEDFDIMVRLARIYPVVYSDHIGIRKRIHEKSFSTEQYRPFNSRMLPSTLRICQKIKDMNKNPKENAALMNRIMFETKHALGSANFDVAKCFLDLAGKAGGKGIKYTAFNLWAWSRLDLSWLYLKFKRG